MDLNNNNIIWSKGPLQNEYSKKHTESPASIIEIQNIIKSVTKENNIVFIRNGSNNNVNDLELFTKHLHLLNNPIILFTTDGDRSMPSTHDYKIVKKLLKSNMIIKWYTQNYDKSVIHPKLKHFPIGFDLHTPNWLVNNSISEKIKYMIKIRNNCPTDKRISTKILSDTHLSNSHPDRKRLYGLLKNNKHIYFLDNKLSFTEVTMLYNQFNFVLSPRGNGLDCHRTWDLFLAGVIVITKTSSLDDMYIKHNLPVVILKYWCELNENNLETKLNQWYNTYINRTSINNIFPKLTFNYWLNT